jgi:hypothetical protein
VTLFDIYKLIEFIVNKDYSGNTITPEDFKMLIKFVNIDMFRRKYGLPEEYQPGRPIPVEFANITLKNTDDIKSFKKELLGVSVINGILSYPADYAHRESVIYNWSKSINGVPTILPRPVEILQDEHAAERRGNWTKKPSLQYPIGVIRSNGIHIYPETISSVDFSYYRWPIEPVFDYVEYDGYITYNPATSTELEWPIDEHFNICRRCLELIGVNLREQDVIQYARTKLKEG